MKEIVVIGAVNSTKWIIEKLIFHGFEIKGVLGLESSDNNVVSGWVDLKEISNSYGLSYMGFRKINEEKNLSWVKSLKPDIIFAVGFSQLLKEEWFQVAKYGCIGFHPTRLPHGRGRAPIAWLVYELNDGAATFFLMGEGVDDGPVFVQIPFSVTKEDNASSVEYKIQCSINAALDIWLPELIQGIWNPIPQNEFNASYYGKRSPEDGIIDWKESAFQIDRLIKSTTHPHPGAYSYFKSKKFLIWSSKIENDLSIKGVIGRVLKIDSEKGYLVQTGDGLLWLTSIECESKITVGDKFGFNVQDEIYKIKLKLDDAR